ncbi:MAG: acyltransferase [Gammaproteobacteria bacterium]
MILQKIYRSLRHFLLKKLAILVNESQQALSKDLALPFRNQPKNIQIDYPRNIVNPEHIWLGNDIRLGPGSLLIAIKRYPGPAMRAPQYIKTQLFNPSITIGNRVTSTGGLQIACVNEIVIEDDVLFATNINITDALHGFENINVPYKYQNLWRAAPIRIKKACWIGQNTVIMPGVTIGEYSIIGANSVVTKNIPDHCIAVGSPAKVVKKWDKHTDSWRIAT